MKNIIPLNIICDVVSEHFNCESIEVFSKSRKREIILRRQWFQYLSRILNPEYMVTSTEIGMYYSDVSGQEFDHATVLHNVKKIKGYIDIYPSYARLNESLTLSVKLKHGETEEKPTPLISEPVGYFCSPVKMESIKKDYQNLCFQNQ